MANQLITSIPEITIDGFQVVSGEMFAHVPRKSEPTCTIWYNSIAFNKMALVALNNCERVRIEINPKTKCLLLIPVTAKDKDGIRWTKSVKDPVARKIECKAFTSQLYDIWEWNKEFVYRSVGRIVSADKKVMLLFEYSEPENWKCKEKVKKNG